MVQQHVLLVDVISKNKGVIAHWLTEQQCNNSLISWNQTVKSEKVY